jgi:hypothetical protein
VPDDIAPPQFFADLVGHVLSVSPVAHHVRVRGLRERRDILVAEADSATGEDTVVTLCRDSARVRSLPELGKALAGTP